MKRGLTLPVAAALLLAAVFGRQYMAPDDPLPTDEPFSLEKPAAGDTRVATPNKGGSTKSGLRPEEEFGRVVDVIDGDTIKVKLTDGVIETIRYIGIDAWETNQLPHGRHGTAANARLVEGKRVRLVRDKSERDRYGRLLRYVYVGDEFVNAALVRTGHAKAKRYKPDTLHGDKLGRLQTEAMAEKRGCWSHPRQAPDGAAIGNRNSRKLHVLSHADCRAAIASMKDKNKRNFADVAGGERSGFELCGYCW